MVPSCCPSFLLKDLLLDTRHSFPNSAKSGQRRGLPTGASEAPVIFLALSIWWESGGLAWEEMQEWSPLFMAMGILHKELLATDSIVYADDKNLSSVFAASAESDITYTHSTGTP